MYGILFRGGDQDFSLSLFTISWLAFWLRYFNPSDVLYKPMLIVFSN